MLLQLLPWRLSAKGVDKVELELTTSLTPGATSACQPKRRRMAWVRPPTGAALLHMRRHFAVPAGRPRHFAVRGYMEAATRERRGRHGLGSHARPPARATRGRYPERLPRPSPSSPCWMAWPMASTTRSCCAPCSVGCMPTHHAAVWKAARWSTPHVSTRELPATPHFPTYISHHHGLKAVNKTNPLP